MARPVTLFTGQWADLPFETVCAKAKTFGYEGLELACWGDHFEVDKALADKGYVKKKWEILKAHGLKAFAISAHLVGQAVCDLIDERHKSILPPEVWGGGDPESVRQRAAQRMIDTAKACRLFIDAAPEPTGFAAVVNGFTGSSIWHSIYAFPPTDQKYWQKGFDDFAKRFAPILASVALFGLGSSGLDAARALLAGGADVAAWDDKEASRDKAASAGIAIVDLHETDWSRFSAFVLAPGVPLTHPAPHWTVPLARAAGVEIVGDIELFCRERAKIAPSAPFVAITGTNGKSTTTALTAHLFRSFGHEVAMGGNIGTPILQLPPPSPDRVHVVECSSFQIDLAPTLNPSVGLLMNLTPDHLDRHGTMAAYAAIKARLVAGASRAVVSIDDPDCQAIATHLRGQGRHVAAISVAGHAVADGITRDGTALIRWRDGRAQKIADLDGIASLRGAHNAQNAAAAILALGEEADDLPRLQAALASFPGLAHRMEQVGKRDGVLFINDSKATNADAAEKALLAFPRVHWIIGGRAKEGGIEPLRPLFSRVAKAYCIGEAGPAFATTLHEDVPFEMCGTIDVAVKAAAADARATHEASGEDEVVLLSPACASQDQFADFEKRGEAFRQLVEGLLNRSP